VELAQARGKRERTLKGAVAVAAAAVNLAHHRCNACLTLVLWTPDECDLAERDVVPPARVG